MFFQIFVALLSCGVVRTVPNAQSQSIDVFEGNSVYPNYYVRHSTPPFSNFENSFARAAFLPGSNFVGTSQHLISNPFNRTDENEKSYDEKTAAAFAAAFGDKDYDKNGDKSETRIKATVYSSDNAENANVVDPFLAAVRGTGGKSPKSAGDVAAVKAAKVVAADAKSLSFVNPFHGNGFDAIFGPEIAARYEIRYTPPGGSFGSVNYHPLPATGDWNDSHFGLQPNFNAAFGPPSSWYPSSYPASYPTSYSPPPFPPQYPSLLPSYPFPNSFFPAHDPKGLKPKGKDDGGEKKFTAQSASETTSENLRDSASESSTEGASASTTESSSSSSSSSSESSIRASAKK